MFAPVHVHVEIFVVGSIRAPKFLQWRMENASGTCRWLLAHLL